MPPSGTSGAADIVRLGRPGRLLSLALDPAVLTPTDAASERILDAAVGLAAASGLMKLTMDGVARRAGVGRMTVYRRFGSREDLVQALAVRETRRALMAIGEALGGETDPVERLAAGFVAALRIARENPLLRRLGQLEPEAILAVLNDPGDSTLDLVREFLAREVRAGQRAGGVRSGDPDAIAELMFRIGLSFVLMPRGVIEVEDDERAREVARTLIAPLLVSGR